jgi:hypothetical protein
MSIPRYKKNTPLRFAKRAPRHLNLVHEFKIRDDGSIMLSDWLKEQTLRFDKKSRELTGHSFAERCVAWFKQHREHVVRSRKSATITPRKPIGLVSVSDEMEIAFAHAGIRMQTL